MLYQLNYVFWKKIGLLLLILNCLNFNVFASSAIEFQEQRNPSALIECLTQAIDERSIDTMKRVRPEGELLLQQDLDDPTRITLLSTLGIVTFLLQDEVEGRGLITQGIDLSEKCHISDQALMMRPWFYLGVMNEHQNNYGQALANFEKSLFLHQRYFSENFEHQALIQLHLAKVHQKLCHFPQAYEFAEQSYAAHQELFGPEDAKTYLSKLYIAVIHENSGKYKEAQELLSEYATFCEKNNRTLSGKYAWTKLHLAHLEHKTGFPKKAQNLYEEAINIYKTLYPDDSIIVAWSSMHLGNFYRSIGKFEEAEQIIEKSLPAYQKIYTEGHICLAWVSSELGKIYRDTGRYYEAKELIGQSLITYIKEYGEDHLKTGFMLRDMGQLYFLQKKLDQAENYFHEALIITKKNDSPESYINFEKLADVYLQKSSEASIGGDQILTKKLKDFATKFLTQSLSIAKSYLPSDSPYVLRINNKLEELRE